MSELLKKLEEMVSPGPAGSDSRNNQTPEAWRPRLEIDQEGGYFISTPRKAASEIPDAAELLKEAEDRFAGLKAMIDLTQADRVSQQTNMLNRILDTPDPSAGVRK